MADIMNPPQTQQQYNTYPSQDSDDGYAPDWSQNPYPPRPQRPLPRTPPESRGRTDTRGVTTETQEQTGVQDAQGNAQSVHSVSGSTGTYSSTSRVSSAQPFDWRYQPGMFYGSYAPPAPDMKKYQWSELWEPDRNANPIRMPFPAEFNDKESDVEPYIMRTALYISIHPKQLRANAEQVYLFLQGCTGKEGRPWAATIMRQYLEERDNKVSRPEVANLRQICLRFRKRFGVLNKERVAQAKLELLTQGTTPVRTYVAAFEQLAQEAAYDSNALVRFFRRGLNTGLRKRIDDMESRPQTITAWKEIALEKDAEHHAEQQEERAWYAAPPRSNQPPPAAPVVPPPFYPPPPQPPAAPQQRNVNQTPPRNGQWRPWSSVAQPARQQVNLNAMPRDPRCYRCGLEDGHFAANCTTPVEDIRRRLGRDSLFPPRAPVPPVQNRATNFANAGEFVQALSVDQRAEMMQALQAGGPPGFANGS